MGFRAKLKDLISAKGSTGEYYCFMVPQELRFWHVDHPWESFNKKYNVIPAGIKVLVNLSTNVPTIIKYSYRNPKRLPCGILLTGRETMRQTHSMRFSLRVDSTLELNTALQELASEKGVKGFEVIELEVYNKNKGATLFCEKHTPNGGQSSLYIVAFNHQGSTVLYPNILLSTMSEYVGKFQDGMAHCTIVMAPQAGCAIEAKTIKKQVKRKRK